MRKKKKQGFFSRLFRRNRRRSFDAAKTNRLLNDWVTGSKSADFDIENDLDILRARSRNLCNNNDYGKKFMNMLAVNVIGANGIKLQSKVKLADGVLDTETNDKIEAAWKKWCKKGNCTVDRRHSLKDVQRLVIQTVARDGEILIRKAPGYKNDFRFALQVIEPDYLNVKHKDDRKNIRMGIESNRWKQPIAYHILKKHPGDRFFSSVPGEYTRVPAKEIIHLYISDRAEQTRGIPWTATALKRLHMLGHYEQSELVSARVGSGKMGFLQSPQGFGYQGDDTDADGNIITEVSPGKIEQLPQGYEFKAFDIDHPNAGFDQFIKAVLRGASAGLNVSYNSLSNNLSDVNYASMRHGTIEERDGWMLLQSWMIEHFFEEIYSEWLNWAIVSNQLDLNMQDIERINSPMWQPRRWAWVDPLKDMQANTKAIEMGLRSRTDIVAESGGDVEDIFEQLSQEKESAEKLDIKIEKEQEVENEQDDKDRKNVSQLHLQPRRVERRK